MPNFFKNLFSSSSNKKDEKPKPTEKSEKKEVKETDEGRDFTPPYDTKRKLTQSRSGRFKDNNKIRGRLGDDLFGETPRRQENTTIEYHVNKHLFFDNPPMCVDDHSRSHIEPVSFVNGNVINDSEDALENNKHHVLSQSTDVHHHHHNLKQEETDTITDDLAEFEQEISNILSYNETNF